MAFAELHALSHYSFLRSAAAPEELVCRAEQLGYSAIAITDECSVGGVVKAYEEAKQRDIKLIIGSEFHIADYGTFVVLAPTREAYAELSQKITEFRGRSKKGSYQANIEDFFTGFSGCFLLWLPNFQQHQLVAVGKKLCHVWHSRFWLLYERHYQADDSETFNAIVELNKALKARVVCAGGVRMAAKQQQPLFDTMSAIREGYSLYENSGVASDNAERHLRSLQELKQCYPEAWLNESSNIANQCHFCLSELRYEYPAELTPKGLSATAYLRQLTEDGARRRYPTGIPASVKAQYEKELKLIQEMQYEAFFLTIYDLVQFANSQGILYQGRGSAANSVVCFCLGITAVNPSQIEVLFERFISKERNEPPDIDVDFEHERREEIIQYIYKKYTRKRAALAATVLTYRFKSAFRDVGKALGFSEQQLQFYSQNLDSRDKEDSWQQQLIQQHPNVFGSKKGQLLLLLVEQLKGAPRHLSQHVGGFVIASDEVARLVPVENASMPERTVIQWDKTDLETLGLLKVDVLALGMLTALRKMLALVNEKGTNNGKSLTLANIPQEDQTVYKQLHQADSMGIFQIESRAQMTMLPRLKPKTFYDLVIQIAIVRPGPIQGDMVHPYLRRRDGLENVDYPSEAVQSVLKRTLGVPIFQEQVIKLAMVAAGFTGGEADQLRRAMASWGKRGQLTHFEHKLIKGMLERGYTRDFAERLFRQICGFGQYGFPESHSASFANLAYASAWFKTHYPAAFYVGLLNSLPMGFYSASQLVQDGQRHNVEFLPADINKSNWDYEWLSQEPNVVRIGLRQIRSLSEIRIKESLKHRPEAGFKGLKDLEDAGLNKFDIQALAKADALRSVLGHRYQAHWESLSERDSQMPLFAKVSDRPARQLQAPQEVEDIKADYETQGLSLRRHPITLLRAHSKELSRCVVAKELTDCRSGQVLSVAGLVTCRQRPGTSSGVTFFTLEDETGNINVVVWAHTARQFRQAYLTSKLLWVKGVVEIKSGVVHVIAGRLKDLTPLLAIERIENRRFH
jgi:error-prone DNA polymerase